MSANTLASPGSGVSNSSNLRLARNDDDKTGEMISAPRYTTTRRALP